MTRQILVVLFVVALALCGCDDRGTANIESAQQNAVAKEASSSDCVRGTSEALLASQSDFVRISSAEARESVRADSTITLAIRHFGCAHYALDFDFAWPDRQMPPVLSALKDAAGLLERLPFKTEYRQLTASLIASLRKMEFYGETVAISDNETLTVMTPAPNLLRVRYDVAL